jgi:hypothetical protein
VRSNASRTTGCSPVSDVTSHSYSALLRMLDRVVERRAVVFGSLPPGGRDLDLVLIPGDGERVRSALRAQRFEEWQGHWISFADCAVAVVELIPAAKLRLPDDELDAFLAEAVPLAGLSRVAEPAPHHSLLILARRLARARALPSKQRARIDRLLALDPQAWQRARERAEVWSAVRKLARLESLHRRPSGSRPSWLPSPRRPRRTRVIAISGVDRKQTAFHAEALRDALYRLGYDPSIDSLLSAADRESRALLLLWRPVWRRLGHGGVVIAVGHTLDPLALGTVDQDAVRLTRRLRRLRLLAPRPLRAYFLDGPANTSESQRAAAYRPAALPPFVRRLDGELPPDQLCEEIAVDAWHALRRRSRLGTVLRALRARARDLRS